MGPLRTYFRGSSESHNYHEISYIRDDGCLTIAEVQCAEDGTAIHLDAFDSDLDTSQFGFSMVSVPSCRDLGIYLVLRNDMSLTILLIKDHEDQVDEIRSITTNEPIAELANHSYYLIANDVVKDVECIASDYRMTLLMIGGCVYRMGITCKDGRLQFNLQLILNEPIERILPGLIVTANRVYRGRNLEFYNELNGIEILDRHNFRLNGKIGLISNITNTDRETPIEYTSEDERFQIAEVVKIDNDDFWTTILLDRQKNLWTTVERNEQAYSLGGLVRHYRSDIIDAYGDGHVIMFSTAEGMYYPIPSLGCHIIIPEARYLLGTHTRVRRCRAMTKRAS